MGLLDKNIMALPKARGKLIMLAVTGMLDALCIIVQGVSLGTALSIAWKGATDASLDFALIARWAVIFLIGYAGRQVISFARARSMNRFAQERSSELQAALVESTFEGGPAFVQAFGSGNVTTATIEGIDRIENYLELILPKIADLIAIPAVLTIGLFAIDWVSGIIALAMLPCIALYMKMLGMNAREAAARQHGAYVRLGNHFIDTLRGIRTLAFFGRSKAAADDVFTVSEQARKASMSAIQVATLSSLLLDLFRTFALAAIAIMLGFRLMDGSIELLPALAVLIIVPEYFAAIRRFSTDFHASLDGKNQLAAVLKMIEWKNAGKAGKCKDCLQDLRENADQKNSLPDVHALRATPIETPSLSFSDVSYAYGNVGENESANSALHDICFTTKGRKRIGIVGLSGSGKSTLARIVAGFAEPTQGNIEMGDIPIDLCTQEWRDAVAYIPQNPHIFHGSVRDNIAFYRPDASLDAVAAATHAAGLDGVISALPDGLDTLIGESGRMLSGGQAQRIALARAFLDERRHILIFDEPTAHLDLETEYALKETMLPLMEDRLVFFATHRLHWMREMDMLLVLDGGVIAEQGSFEDLISRNGAFSQLARRLSGKQTASSEHVPSPSKKGGIG